MYLGKVIGNVVSTTKSELLTGLKLLLIQQIDMLTMKPVGTPVVIADTVGAGVGEVVMVVTGGSARLTEQTIGKPVDAAIIGIIDTVEMDGSMLFQKYPPQAEEETLPKQETPKVQAEPIAISKSESPDVKVTAIEEAKTLQIDPEVLEAEPVKEKPTIKKPGTVAPKESKSASAEDKKQLLEKVTKKQKH